MRMADLIEAVHRMDVASESEFLLGDPAGKVADSARKMGADLIIRASHQTKFLARLFNLAEAPRIMHRAQCPVLFYHGALAFSPTLR
jgi:nucleotide-binding universal stress UspA family protein